MKTLVLICGVPGSGKSTLAKKLAAAQSLAGHGTAVCEADLFMIDKRGNYTFDPKRLKECHEKCKKQAEDAMIARNQVIVSNTSLTKWERQPYLDLAAKYGYDVQEILIRSPFKSVHGVPEEKIEEMKKRLDF